MVKYLVQVMELPQYEEAFLQYELNGYSFICLDKISAAKVCAALKQSAEQQDGDNDGEVKKATPPSAGQVALHTAKLAFHAGGVNMALNLLIY